MRVRDLELQKKLLLAEASVFRPSSSRALRPSISSSSYPTSSQKGGFAYSKIWSPSPSVLLEEIAIGMYNPWATSFIISSHVPSHGSGNLAKFANASISRRSRSDARASLPVADNAAAMIDRGSGS